MVTQGLGYSGRTIFSGAAEMVARAVVSLGFVGTFLFFFALSGFLLKVMQSNKNKYFKNYNIRERCDIIL